MSTAFVKIDDSEQNLLAGLTPGALKAYLAIKRMAYADRGMTALYHLRLIAAKIESTPSNVAKWVRKLIEVGLLVVEAAESAERYMRLFVPRLAEQLGRYRPGRPVFFDQSPRNPAASEGQPESSSNISADLTERCEPQERRAEREEPSVFSVEKTGQAPVFAQEKPCEVATAPDVGQHSVRPPERFTGMRNKHDGPALPVPTMLDRRNAMRARRGLPPETEAEAEARLAEVKRKAIEHRKNELGIDTPVGPETVIEGALPPEGESVGKMAWAKGVAFLTGAHRYDEAKARKTIGMLKKLAGGDDAKLLRAFTAAEQHNPVDPVPWLVEAVKIEAPAK